MTLEKSIEKLTKENALARSLVSKRVEAHAQAIRENKVAHFDRIIATPEDWQGVKEDSGRITRVCLLVPMPEAFVIPIGLVHIFIGFSNLMDVSRKPAFVCDKRSVIIEGGYFVSSEEDKKCVSGTGEWMQIRPVVIGPAVIERGKQIIELSV